jgi:elongation factor G
MEVEVATKVIDGCVLILDAVSGVQCQTKTVWKKISNRNLPSIALINKMDREGADFYRAMASIQQQLHVPAVALHLPIVSAGAHKPVFEGFVDLISGQAFLWDETLEDEAARVTPRVERVTEQSAHFSAMVEQRQRLLEQVADHDDQFATFFLESDPAPDKFEAETVQQLLAALQRATRQRLLVPVLAGSALRGKGIHQLLDSVLFFLPDPSHGPPRLLQHHSEPGRSLRVLLDGQEAEPSESSRRPRGGRKRQQREQVAAESGEGQLLAQVFKAIHDPMRGFLLFVRVFSGELHAKHSLYNSTRRKEERVQQLLEIASNEYTAVASVGPGEIACLTGLKGSRIGDTLLDGANRRWRDFRLEGMVAPRPVFSQVVEAKDSADQEALEEALGVLAMEDPSFLFEHDAETGQTVLYGLGELHLEIVCDKLQRQHNLPVARGRTSIHYRETVLAGLEAEAVDWTYDRVIDQKRLFAGVRLEFSSSLPAQPEPDDEEDEGADGLDGLDGQEFSFAAQYRYPPASFELAEHLPAKLAADELTTLRDALEAALSQGPRGYPVVGLRVRVLDVQKTPGLTSPGAIRACVATAVSSFLRRPEVQQLLEPVMAVEIDLPNEFLGDVVADLTSKRRAQHVEIRPLHDTHSVVTAVTPLASTLGYITQLRSATRGEAVFSAEYLCHAPVEAVFMQ